MFWECHGSKYLQISFFYKKVAFNATRWWIMTKKEIQKDFLLSLGGVIKKKREKKNITQHELSDFLEVSKSTVSRYESGQTDMPVSTLPLISYYCGFALNDYFYDEKVMIATDNLFEMLKITIESEKVTTKRFTKEKQSEYDKLKTEISTTLRKEGYDNSVDILYVAGRFINQVKDGNHVLAQDISKGTIDYICENDEYIQRCSRLVRKLYEE